MARRYARPHPYIDVSYALLGQGLFASGSGSQRFHSWAEFRNWLTAKTEQKIPVCITGIEHHGEGQLPLAKFVTVAMVNTYGSGVSFNPSVGDNVEALKRHMAAKMEDYGQDEEEWREGLNYQVDYYEAEMLG